VIRVAPLMPISARHTPLYVPVNWLDDDVLIGARATLKLHAWPRPLGPNWVNLNDYDPGFVADWARRLSSHPLIIYGSTPMP
jgi:hypothetical protein